MVKYIKGDFALNISKKCRKAKPIFDPERQMIEEKLPEIGRIPDGCWIVGGSIKYIYLDIYSDTYWIKFKCENGGKFVILKDNRHKFSDYKQMSIEETIAHEKERLEKYYDFCVNRLVDFIKSHPDYIYIRSHSGGKDSNLMRSVWLDAEQKLDFPPKGEWIFYNTTNETADVYKDIKAMGIRIINPDKPWRKWLEGNNYMFPSVARRSCCAIYKEGQAKKHFNQEQSICMVIGVRNQESVKRSQYEFYMDYEFDRSRHTSFNFPKKWSRIAPIIECETVDVWLLTLLKEIHINRRYKLGSMRVGCMICPFSSAYEDEITKTHYKEQWRWFTEAIAKNYENHTVSVLGWNLQEWTDGAWKRMSSKNYPITIRKPTPENIKLLADIKGISEDMAKKYFGATCGTCGKRCNEVEVAMFYKVFGRFEGVEDHRKPLCVKCFCAQTGISTHDYWVKVKEFSEEGCPLF